MKWFRTDIRFEERATIFTVAVNSNAAQLLHSMLAKSEYELDKMAELCRMVVVNSRPALRHCMIFYFGLDPSLRVFEIGVYHPSLPRVAFGEACTKEPL